MPFFCDPGWLAGEMVRLDRAGGAKTNKYFETIVKSLKFNKNDTNKNLDRVKSHSRFLLPTLVKGNQSYSMTGNEVCSMNQNFLRSHKKNQYVLSPIQYGRFTKKIPNSKCSNQNGHLVQNASCPSLLTNRVHFRSCSIWAHSSFFESDSFF